MASRINVINKYYIKNHIMFRVDSTGFVLYSHGDRVSATTKKLCSFCFVVCCCLCYLCYILYYESKHLRHKVLFYVTKPVL